MWKHIYQLHANNSMDGPKDNVERSFMTMSGFSYNIVLNKYQNNLYEAYRRAGVDGVGVFIRNTVAPTNPYPDVIHSYHISNGNNYIVAVFCTCSHCNGPVVIAYMVPNEQLKMITSLDDLSGFAVHSVGCCNCH